MGRVPTASTGVLGDGHMARQVSPSPSSSPYPYHYHLPISRNPGSKILDPGPSSVLYFLLSRDTPNEGRNARRLGYGDPETVGDIQR